MAGKADPGAGDRAADGRPDRGGGGVLRLARRRDGAAIGVQRTRASRARANTDPKVAPGNVVLLFSDERLTRELRELAERTAGPPDPALVAAGQAVVVERRPNLKVPVTAVTATRRLEAAGPSDPKLEGFIEHWLGRAR